MGVALAAVGTDVRLYMLRLLVLGDVLEQRLLVREALVAGVALVRLVSLVAPGVGLQVGQLGEGLGATWQGKTGVRKSSQFLKSGAGFCDPIKFNWNKVLVLRVQ